MHYDTHCNDTKYLRIVHKIGNKSSEVLINSDIIINEALLILLNCNKNMTKIAVIYIHKNYKHRVFASNYAFYANYANYANYTKKKPSYTRINHC